MNEGLLQLVLRMFVNELLIVGDYRLGDGLADSIDLRDMTTSGYADTDVDTGELVETNNQQRFVNLLLRGGTD